jgi:RNA polymerase sigma-70 factor (ECF subfamily)
MEILDIDKNFMLRFRKGDDAVFRDIIFSYQNKIFNLVLGIIRNRQDAEDLTQKIFMSIFKNRKKFKGTSSLYTWIYRIAVNESLNMLKKNKKNSQYFDENFMFDEIDVIDKSDNKLEQKELRDYFDRAIAKLDEKYRTALILKEIECLTYKEISEVLDISMDKVKIWIFRARENLRQIIKTDGGELL